MVHPRITAGRQSCPSPRCRHRTLQPRRPGNSERNRTPKVCCAGQASRNLESSEAGSGRSCRAGEDVGEAAGEATLSTAVGNAPVQFAPTASQLDMAYSVCRSIARSAAKNFYYAFVVLPRRKRNALSTVYAFMRRCDDIADDNTLSPDDRHNKLAEWLDKVHRALAAQPTDDPVLLALTDAQRTYQIPIGLLDQLAYGTAADLDYPQPEPSAGALAARYQTFEELRQYCYGVASVVGLVCIKIFGYRDPAAEPLAERCGLAFQLTNIIVDVKKDVAMGRVFFPQEDLVQCGLSAADLTAPSVDVARIRPLLAMEADRARECYRAGDDLIPMVNEDSQPALWVLITIYRRLLEKIASNQYDVFGERVRLTVREKLTVLGKGILKRLVGCRPRTILIRILLLSLSLEAGWPAWPRDAPWPKSGFA